MFSWYTRRMEKSTWVGAVLALLTLILGQWLLGGTGGQLFQIAALLIVVGGTTASLLAAFPGEDVRAAWRALPEVFRPKKLSLDSLVEEIHRISSLVRKEGLLAAESARDSLKDPLLKKLLKFSMDGLELDAVREIGDAEIAKRLREEDQAGRVWETAGTFAPGVGVLGAVLGLVQVLSNLAKPESLGSGIAIAFVSLVYGLVLSNWILLPWGMKLRRLAKERAFQRELVLMGVLGIQSGVSPQVLREKLLVYLDEPAGAGKRRLEE